MTYKAYCARCPQRLDADSDHVVCPECRRIGRIKQVERRRRLRTLGLCEECGLQTADSGSRACAECKRKNLEAVERYQSRVRITVRLDRLTRELIALSQMERNEVMQAVEDYEREEFERCAK